MKNKFAAVLSALLAVSCVCAPVSAGEEINLDINSDGVVDCFDMVSMRRNPADINGDKVADIKDFTLLSDFLVKRNVKNETPDEYPVDASAILEPKGTVHHGEGTFYGGGYIGGCAMLEPVPKEYWIVAMNLEDYNNAQLAGAYLEVTGESGTINMYVTDLLPEGKKGDLDLYTDAFPLIAPVEKGRVPVSWKIVPFPGAENAPVAFKFKEGSSECWCSVQVRNHRYPVTKLEYLDADGNFVELPRRHYNYFESSQMGAGPFTFRITDIYGQVIVEKDIPLVLDEIIEGKNQFPV